MKRVLSLLLIVAALTLAGCAKNAQGSSVGTDGNNTQTQTETLMDRAELRAIAYAHADVAEADVYDVDEDWEKRSGTTVYELDFKALGVEYEYGLDGSTGKILYSTYENDPEYEDQAINGEITEDAAKEIALTHAGLAETDVTGLRIELDREDKDYDIEFHFDGYEYDYEIDIYSGEILKSEKERD